MPNDAGGPFVGALIASWSAMSTSWNSSSGLKNTEAICSTTSSGQTNVRYRWTAIDVLRVESLEKHLVPNHGELALPWWICLLPIINFVLCTYRPKHPTTLHMWAGISKRVVQGYASLTELWRKSCMSVFWRELCYLSSMMCTKMATNLCRTSLYAREWIHDNEVNWWKMPPESPI